jgi:hypothetical protein
MTSGYSVPVMKKHRQQMKAAEIATVESAVRTYANPTFAQHAYDRMAEKHVTAREIELTLKYGEVIEVHNETGTLRFSYGKPKVAVCVVLDFETNAVVTTWKNAGSDNHKTLNLLAYSWKVDVTKLIPARA